MTSITPRDNPRAEYHDPAIRRARQATARAARKTR